MKLTIFKCPKCGKVLEDFYPSLCPCGHVVQITDGVYQFTDDPAISIQGDGLKWLGYEKVGVNYEPGHAKSNDDGDFGMFGACSRKLAKLLGKDIVVLDLGAGLGPASIPLAIAGAKTIGIDISQNMLKAMVMRASGYGILDLNLICARMNAYDLKIMDSSIDAVIEIDMLHQVSQPDLVVKEIKRILKPDGIYIKYGYKGLPLTEAQLKSNDYCNQIESDIKSFYRSLVEVNENVTRPFSSWEEADKSRIENFSLSKIIETDEIQNWVGDIDFKLHKMKTRASGGDQLIPDEIHNEAWRRTEEYAIHKYGREYGKMKRYSRFVGQLEIYTQI